MLHEKRERKMSFTFNNFNGSSKSNTTASHSTNSPLNTNLNTDDIVKNTGDKSNLNIDSSGSKSDNNSPLFVFGKDSQARSSNSKTPEGFNFVFNSNSFDPNSSRANTQLKVVGASSFNFKANNICDDKKMVEPTLEDKTKAELDSDNNNEDSNENFNENGNENSVKNIESNNQEQRQDDGNAPKVDITVVTTLIKEFKDVIRETVSSFVKERIEGERKIATLEGRLHTLEEEIQNLKNAGSKESSTVSVADSNDTAATMVNSVSQPPLEKLPIPVSSQAPSPLIPSLPGSPTLKKSSFGSTSSMFGASNSSIFSGTSKISFGTISSSLLGTDGTDSSNFALPVSAFNSNASTQNQGVSQLFCTTIPNSNQNGKNMALERKKGNPQKLFTQEAVTTFLNAQKDSGISSGLAKANTGNLSRKKSVGEESLEHNPSMTKEAFQASLQNAIEMSVKNIMEQFWNDSKNNSENNFKKFNNGSMF